MKKIITSYKKTLILLSVFFCWIILLLIYSFYPIISYKEGINSLPWRIYITDRNGKVITDKARKNGYYKKILTESQAGDSPLDNNFIKALIQIEDKNFYNNYWISLVSKLRAIKDNIVWKKISWWSTLTEQYIKNKYFIWEKRNYLQKLREAIVAAYFSVKYSKDNILENYLNTAYFGNNIYGILGALEVYFQKSKLEDLEEDEIVLLLGLLHAPSTEFSWEKYFLDYQEKIKKRLWYSLGIKKMYFKKYKKKNTEIFPFVTKRVLEEVCEEKREEFSILLQASCWREVVVQSTIDSQLQKYAKETIKRELLKLGWKNVTNWAIFWIIPKFKEILIYQWSKDFYAQDIDGQVDVIQSKRQPWSTVKPFLYLMALKFWMNPDDLIVDLESEYNSFQEWKHYVTENYSLREYWLVRLKKALWNSMNNASVRLASELWLENVFNFYKKYWFNFDYEAQHYWYSLVLWNAEIKLEDLVVSYSQLLWKSANKFLLEDILKDSDNRDISFWVNSILNTSIPQAVKTGTSSDFRDNMLIWYHSDFIIGIWVWNNDNSSMVWVTGITWAGRIWHDVIEKTIALWYIASLWRRRDSSIPEWIEEQEYCLDRNCFRKEIIYKKVWKEYYSRILNNYFSNKDLQEKLSDFEEKRLSQMWIKISE